MSGRSYRRGWEASRLSRRVVSVLLLLNVARLLRSFARTALFRRSFAGLTEAVDKAVGWHKLPLPAALVTLIGVRMRLRAANLHDTGTATAKDDHVPAPSNRRHLTARTADGTYNDLDHPRMGSASTRFGRNVPVELTHQATDRIMEPNPRTVSRELLTRKEFQPATTLNVLAAAWLQFMIRDWFSHGKSPTENPWQVPLADDDPWPERPMRVLRTPPDPTRMPEEAALPPTYLNTESHWWDGSQLYGSNAAAQAKVRSGREGKLRIGTDGMPPVDPNPDRNPVDEPGFWLGLAMLGTVFTLEHNAICDRLRAEYPSWSDDDLFDRARLITSALLAKIHTVEWTTAILGHPALRIGMRSNWWGLLGERIYRTLGRVSPNEMISGIVGGPTNHFDVPFSLTEEFVAVYRMHPLIPDDYAFRSVGSGALLRERDFSDLINRRALELMDEVSMPDLLYSFGIAHPGAVALHNFPRGLQSFTRPDGFVQDLAATDILRSRELGVPRYNEFRRQLHLNPIRSWEDLTENERWRADLRRVYGDDVEQLDLTVGMFAEKLPADFGFSDTAFRIFVLMASRRLNSDRFFTTDYNARVYTQVGMDWIDENDMSSVLLRHYPSLAPALRGVANAFAPWKAVAADDAPGSG